MELWVRSQDRRRLSPIDSDLYIPISRTDEDFGIVFNDVLLGTYKSKERALEVLDEVQKLLIPIVECTPIVEEDIKPEYTYKHYVNCGFNTKVTQLNTYVYEMPKE